MGTEWTLILVPMPPHIGQPVRRIEDERLITGRGRYAGDIKLEGLLHIAFVRSPMPHARIAAIDTSAAKTMPGVVAVWTASDLPEVAPGLSDFGPTGIVQRGRPILTTDEVNYVGEAYAVAIAETEYQARDAAEAIAGELDPLPGVGDVMTATAEAATISTVARAVSPNSTRSIFLRSSQRSAAVPAMFTIEVESGIPHVPNR